MTGCIKRSLRIALSALLVLTPCASFASGSRLAVIDTSRASRSSVDILKSECEWTTELGDVLVVSASSGVLDSAARTLPVSAIESLAANERLFVGMHLHPTELTGTNLRLIASSGTLSVLAGPAGSTSPHADARLQPLEREVVYAEHGEPHAAKTAEADPYADAVIGSRWLHTVRDLADFGTRYTGTSGALAARDYIASEFAALGLDVTMPAFDGGSGPAWNVVGELRGTTREDDVFIVCGHYDSISEDPSRIAPGAEDNGSGSAGVIELARLFAANPPGATLRFIAFSGEEEGLYGSSDYVSKLSDSGEARRVKGVINMDMIGFTRDNDLDVLLETGASGRDLVNELAASAAAVTNLRVVKSFNPFGSDHVPFIENGIPCVLTIENDWDQYSAYHSSRDTIDNVRVDMGTEVLRMNAATLGRLAAGPPPGDLAVTVRVPFDTNRTTLRGGVAQDVDWSIAGENPESFDVAYSVDGGATFTGIAQGLSGETRRAYWTVPNGVSTNSAVVRVTAHRPGTDDVFDLTDDPLKIKPSSGPVIRDVSFKARVNGDFVVKGLFGSTFQSIQVNGVDVAATIINTRVVRGNTAKQLVGVSGGLDAVFPRGVEVLVRVVDLRTGAATPEFAVTR